MNENNLIEKGDEIDVGLTAGLKEAVINHARKTTEKTDQLVAWVKLEVFQVYLSISLFIFYFLVAQPKAIAAQQLEVAMIAEQEAYKVQAFQVQEALFESDKVQIQAAEAIDKAYKAMFSCEDTLIDAHKYFDEHLEKRQNRGQ